MRIAVYTQHFVGVGHHMRATRLARAFCRANGGPHDVVVFDGGCPVPGTDPDQGVCRVQLPPLLRGTAGIETVRADLPLSAVLVERQQEMVAGIRHLRPDLLVIDSFPFSRWALREEILAAISQAKTSNAAVRVVCSVRDVPRASQERFGSHVRGWDSSRGRPWPIQPDDDVLEELPEVINACFHALLIHGDPRVTRLEDHFPWVGRLRVPVHYTGYVKQEAAAGQIALAPEPGPLIVVSVGGGINGLRLIELATAAFGELRQRPRFAPARMAVFAGAFMSDAELAKAAAACSRHSAQFKTFSREFPAWLRGADLSVSRGGYNTVVATLAAGVRALILPAANVSDQAFRIQRLADLGIVSTRPEADLDAGSLAERMSDVLDRQRPVHNLDLAGAERTVQIATEMVTLHAESARAAPRVLARVS